MIETASSTKRLQTASGKPPRKTSANVEPARSTLNMRVLPETRRLIDQAAQITGKNRTAFILDAARRAAQEAVLSEIHIQISPKAFAAFLAMLDEPVKPNSRLRKTLQKPPVWK